MIPFEILPIAHIAVETLKNHWEVAAAPFGDAMLWEAGKSLYKMLQQRFAGSIGDDVLEEAAADPTDHNKSDALVQQLKIAMEAAQVSDRAGAIATVGACRRSLDKGHAKRGQKRISTERRRVKQNFNPNFLKAIFSPGLADSSLPEASLRHRSGVSRKFDQTPFRRSQEIDAPHMSGCRTVGGRARVRQIDAVIHRVA